MIVADLMTRDPAFVHADETLGTAARIMWERECGAVPVIESQGDTLVGMLTDRDICMAAWSRGLALDSISVADAMSQDLVRCGPEDSISGIETLMAWKQVRRIPVEDAERHLVGILSLADIARAASDPPDAAAGHGISSVGIATMLAGICRTPSATVHTSPSL